MKRLFIILFLISLASAPLQVAAADAKAASKEEIVGILMEADNRFAEGEYDSAITLYKRLISVAPENREGYLGLGRIALLRDDSQKAIGYFRQAISASPQSAPAHFELGSTLLSLGNLSEALKELSLAYDLDPSRPEIQFRLSQARSLIESSRLTPEKTGAGSLGRDTAAGSTRPGTNPGTNTATGSARRRLLLNPPPETGMPILIGGEKTNIDEASEVSLVYRLLTSGRVEETIAQGLSALKAQPDNASLRYQLGLMYKVKGDIDTAISTFQEALKYSPEHTQSLAQLAALYISRNQIDEAKLTATRWVAADENNPTAHFNLAWTHIIERSFKDALPHLKAATQLDPRNTDLLNHLGLVLRELGNDREAVIYFQRALALNPLSVPPRLNLAMIELYDQKSDAARQLIKPLLEVSAITPRTRSVEALIDAREGNLDEAQKKARDVLKSVPNSALASLALAIVARQNGKLDDAATILETTLEKQPRSALVLHGLAEVYLAKGQVQNAIEYAQLAHDRSPNKFIIAKTLALALAKGNNTVVALDTLKRMRELGNDPDKLFLLEGAVLEAANDRDGALKHYLSLREQQPENDEIAIKVAHLYLIERKFKNADYVIDDILRRTPEHNQARLLKAEVLYELKDYKGSLKQTQSVTRDEDLDYQADCLTARASFKLKRYADAAQLFKSARNKGDLSTDDLVMLARSLKEIDAGEEAATIVAQIKKGKSQSKELKAELKRIGRASQ